MATSFFSINKNFRILLVTLLLLNNTVKSNLWDNILTNINSNQFELPYGQVVEITTPLLPGAIAATINYSNGCNAIKIEFNSALSRMIPQFQYTGILVDLTHGLIYLKYEEGVGNEKCNTNRSLERVKDMVRVGLFLQSYDLITLYDNPEDSDHYNYYITNSIMEIVEDLMNSNSVGEMLDQFSARGINPLEEVSALLISPFVQIGLDQVASGKIGNLSPIQREALQTVMNYAGKLNLNTQKLLEEFEFKKDPASTSRVEFHVSKETEKLTDFVVKVQGGIGVNFSVKSSPFRLYDTCKRVFAVWDSCSDKEVIDEVEDEEDDTGFFLRRYERRGIEKGRNE